MNLITGIRQYIEVRIQHHRERIEHHEKRIKELSRLLR